MVKKKRKKKRQKAKLHEKEHLLEDKNKKVTLHADTQEISIQRENKKILKKKKTCAQHRSYWKREKTLPDLRRSCVRNDLQPLLLQTSC